MATLIKLPRILPDKIMDCYVNPDTVCYVQPIGAQSCFLVLLSGGLELEINLDAREVVNLLAGGKVDHEE